VTLQTIIYRKIFEIITVLQVKILPRRFLSYTPHAYQHVTGVVEVVVGMVVVELVVEVVVEVVVVDVGGVIFMY